MGEQTFVARMQRSGTNDTGRVRQTVTGTDPWGRLGVPLDIATGIVFLASDDAGYMSGAGLIVDGGYLAA
jgi:NAD(P)-dependent dehydrogenase (short-subunit alcohol dehydrogenase family)